LFLLGAGAFIILYSLTKSERKEEWQYKQQLSHNK
jgi:hypothetical protein